VALVTTSIPLLDNRRLTWDGSSLAVLVVAGSASSTGNIPLAEQLKWFLIGAGLVAPLLAGATVVFFAKRAAQIGGGVS
jgi:hypothetical protein